MRVQVGPWAWVGFNLGRINPLGDLGLASPGTVDSPRGLARRVSLGGINGVTPSVSAYAPAQRRPRTNEDRGGGRAPRAGELSTVGMPPFTIGAVPSTYRVQTAPLSDEHHVFDERVEELRTALEAVGARSIDVSREVTFELDAQRGSDAMADVSELLFALSWPPAVTASIVR